jgi:hypothetical protein
MNKFLRNIQNGSFESCTTCGADRPDCEETLNAIIAAMPMNETETESRPIVPRDISVMNYCVEALARVAACRANKTRFAE